MPATVGSKLHELIVDTKARELIELMESTAPELRKLVSRKEANEAMLDALTSIEGETPSGLSYEVVDRAKALVRCRLALN